MKVTFKDLKQQKFVLEFEPSALVSAVKEKLQEEHDWEPKDQKLIYSGKILKDDQTLESYGIEEKGYIVCMVSKPKPKPAAAAPAAAAPAAAEPATPARESTSVATPAAPAPVATSSSTQAAAPSTPTPQRDADSATAPSGLTVGAERAAAIDNMVAMGFERADVERAMRAAFFNPERAVEYILTGIPENLQEQRQAPQAAAATAPTTATAGGDDNVNLFDLAAQRGGAAGGDAGGADIGGALEFLRASPQFQQLRLVVQQNPQMLEPLLQQLSTGNPEIAHIIASNPEQFLELLSEENDDDVPLPPNAQQIEVTAEERDAIERLCRLGFDRDQAIQAYFACDKDEELAANFLFESPDDEDPAPGV